MPPNAFTGGYHTCIFNLTESLLDEKNHPSIGRVHLLALIDKHALIVRFSLHRFGLKPMVFILSTKYNWGAHPGSLIMKRGMVELF